VTEDSAQEALACDFQGARGGHQQLLPSDADEPISGSVSPGLRRRNSAGLQLAVERAFDGKVIFDRARRPDEQTPLAALATALLRWWRLR
jgi:hypothetical protein